MDWPASRKAGVSAPIAFRYVRAYTRAIDAPREKSVQASRAKHVSQLAVLKRSLMMSLLAGGTPARDKAELAKAYIAATNEQARLNGEHMPVKVASTTPDGETWAPLAVDQLVAKFSVEELKVLERAQKVRLGLPSDDVLEAEVVSQ